MAGSPRDRDPWALVVYAERLRVEDGEVWVWEVWGGGGGWVGGWLGVACVCCAYEFVVCFESVESAEELFYLLVWGHVEESSAECVDCCGGLVVE